MIFFNLPPLGKNQDRNALLEKSTAKIVKILNLASFFWIFFDIAYLCKPN
jgi:hypothetical protein